VVVVVLSFNLSKQEAEASRFLEFEASLVYRVSFMTAMATRETLSQTTTTTKQNKTKNLSFY
jgi:7-keto-8-aminopelargonate synthetase-like enzyme